jgi:aspartate dehydrogenase
MRVVLIGYGAIAQTLCRLWPRDAGVELAGVLVRPGRAAALADRLPDGVPAVESVPAALDLYPDLVAECAGHGAVRESCPAILAGGVDVATVSNGVLADDAVLDSLVNAARRGGAQLRVCAGALTGIDGLAAAAYAGLDSVVHTVVKPPRAWTGTPAEDAVDLAALRRATPVFEGSARAAAMRYPANANATATTALAGLGLDATAVRLVADPEADGNRHVLKVAGAFGRFDVEIAGRPLDANPKTSSLTAYSLLRAIAGQGAAVVL